jgi:hypothetical protein
VPQSLLKRIKKMAATASIRTSIVSGWTPNRFATLSCSLPVVSISKRSADLRRILVRTTRVERSTAKLAASA